MVDQNRKRENIRVYSPSDQSVYVDVPLIKECTVTNQNGQEHRVAFDNTQNSNREVHTDTVKNSGGDGSQLQVERIEKWHCLDIPDNAQETDILLDNNTGSDSTPPSFTAHFKTHVYRLSGQNGAWIDTEYIDEAHVTDQNGQEYYWVLDNQDQQADDADDRRDADSPVRTDLFQNIVDVHWPKKDQEEEPGTFEVVISGLAGVGVAYEFGANNPVFVSRTQGWPDNPPWTQSGVYAWFASIGVGTTGVSSDITLSGASNQSGNVDLRGPDGTIPPWEQNRDHCISNPPFDQMGEVTVNGTLMTVSAQAYSASNYTWWGPGPLLLGVFALVGGLDTLMSFTIDFAGITAHSSKTGTTWHFDSVVSEFAVGKISIFTGGGAVVRIKMVQARHP